MDPLGAPSQFVDIDSLPAWNDYSEANQLDSHKSQVEKPQLDVRSPFPYRKDINAKIILWKGNVALLNCTAIVNTSNESLTDKNAVSESIFMHAGPNLRDELLKLKGCRTGEAKLTKGFNLAARFIIHTVGPKYKSRYRTAAESSLYSCYRNVLQLAKEQAMSSVGFCVINSVKRGYPLEDATHIALRTVRRFLEIHGETLEKVVFAVSELEQAIYQKLLPLYFPRSLEEECHSLPCLPADIGNSEGEPVVPERQIRISEKPGAPDVTIAGYVRQELKTCLTLLLSKPYIRQALLYFIHVMDHIAVKEYVIVYFHTLTSDYNHLDSDFLKKLYDIVDIKYKRNLKAVYFVHPTFRSKVSTWFFTTFTISGLKDKIHYVENLQQLFTAIPPEQIDFPPFVLEYDARENGPYYSYPSSPDL
ncbi:ganglioside-induced differentiation-associated protein 2 isoform X4 [Dermochelys coriacea]|uniref:ganglioside-induced differentiation-associated protein 2 isoform X4 n=1 Tax=Dermochelys coriacea TaxID=27794 RepID=UPI001CA9251F|nr:ganglioside-induced differentiation-associated protein 2 isoform X4 [Dermochelys coriacea]